MILKLHHIWLLLSCACAAYVNEYEAPSNSNLNYLITNLLEVQNNIININKKFVVMEKQIGNLTENVKENFAKMEKLLDGNTIPRYPTECSQFNQYHCHHNKCVVRNIIYRHEPFHVLCDQRTDGGGWTIIQKRYNGALNFYRNFSDYRSGFGDVEREFWFGLDKLYALTTAQPMELYIKLRDFKNIEKYARYDLFSIANKSEAYKILDIGAYSGSAGDCFSKHKGSKFTTRDMDNDVSIENCAKVYHGGWWYFDCYRSNLNGKYYPEGVAPPQDGISWCTFHDYYYSMKSVQMMIRPKK